MAEATLNDVITALQQQNSEDILQNMADQNAALGEQLAASEEASQKRFEESEKQRSKEAKEARDARIQASIDALNEKNESQLTGKDKSPNKKGRLGGLMESTKKRVGGIGAARFATGGIVGGLALSTLIGSESFQKAGEIVNNFVTGAKNLLDESGIEFPKLTDMYTEGNRILSSALDGIIAIQEGDFAAFKDAVPELATSTAILSSTFKNMMGGLDKGIRNATAGVTNAFKSMGSGLTKAKNFVTGSTPKVPDGNERMAINRRTTGTLSGSQKTALEAKGIKLDKAGNLIKDGKRLKVGAADEALKGVGASTSTSKSRIRDGAQKKIQGMAKSDNKYVKGAGKLAQYIGPKGAKVLGGLQQISKRIPVLGQLLGVGTLGMIAMDENLSSEQKAKEMAKVFGGLGGATLGAIAGSTLGTALIPIPGIGTAIGGIGGGIFGSMFGEEIAEALAGAIMGDAPKPSSDMQKLVAEMSGSSKQPSTGGVGSSLGSSSGVSAMPSTTGSALSSGQNAYQTAQTQVAGNTNIVAPQSTTNNIGGANAMVTNGLTPVDPFAAGTSYA